MNTTEEKARSLDAPGTDPAEETLARVETTPVPDALTRHIETLARVETAPVDTLKRHIETLTEALELEAAQLEDQARNLREQLAKLRGGNQ